MDPPHQKEKEKEVVCNRLISHNDFEKFCRLHRNVLYFEDLFCRLLKVHQTYGKFFELFPCYVTCLKQQKLMGVLLVYRFIFLISIHYIMYKPYFAWCSSMSINLHVAHANNIKPPIAYVIYMWMKTHCTDETISSTHPG